MSFFFINPVDKSFQVYISFSLLNGVLDTTSVFGTDITERGMFFINLQYLFYVFSKYAGYKQVISLKRNKRIVFLFEIINCKRQGNFFINL